MAYKIIADSCCDMTPELKERLGVEIVPLTLTLGDKNFTDDETLDLPQFMAEMKSFTGKIGSAAPSPQLYKDAFDGPHTCFAVTLSSNLSASYSSAMLGKRMAEHYCYIYHKQYKVPVKIARLAQVYGYGVDPDDNRVFAQFARAASSGEDVVLHTEGLSMGNYCESRDAINALLIILDRGQDGEAYNVVNEDNTMRICDMAMLVAERIAEGKIKVLYDIQKHNVFGYARDTKLRLSSEKLRKLGWKPRKNIEEMYRDLISHMYKK